MAEEERFDGAAAGVEGGEGAKGNGSVGEGVVVAVSAKDLVDAGESPCATFHQVVGGHEAIAQLVPWWCAGEDDLDHDAEDVEVAEGGSVEFDGAGRSEDEEEGGDDEGTDKVDDACWYEGQRRVSCARAKRRSNCAETGQSPHHSP